MTQDVESSQLHMVVAKPVSRIKIFLAKYSSVVLLHAILLFFAGIAIYGIVMFRVSSDTKMTDADRAELENEVLVGRRVFLPTPPDLDRLAGEALAKKMSNLGVQVQDILNVGAAIGSHIGPDACGLVYVAAE